MTKQAYIVGGIRTAIGNFGGTLAAVRTDDLAAHVLRELMNKYNSVDPSAINDVILGCANQSGEDNRNVARMAVLLAGLPVTVPGETVNRLCASGLTASMAAARTIMCNEGDLMIAGGVENMTRGPWVISKTSTPYGRDAQMFDSSFGWRFINPKMKEMYGVDAMGETAENVAAQWKITREEQDAFAVTSQQKYAAAHAANRFSDELIPVPLPQKKGDPVMFDKDEHPRLSSLEELGKLKPAFKKDGTVTAGNSSGVNDGSAALLLASEDAVKKYNLTPMARIVARGVAGVDPAIMGIGPVPATQKALQRAGLKVSDIGLFELNEAFASQSIACMRELNVNPEIVNVNGGAIALGHPLGCSGARISTTLLHEMKKQNVKYGVATMCIGVGQGVAVVYENL